MKYNIVIWFINWAKKHFAQYWLVSYTRRGIFTACKYESLNSARARAHQIITNFEEATTLDNAYLNGAHTANIQHYIGIKDICNIHLPQNDEIFLAAKRPEGRIS